ncbi:hypothetical protein [Klenkia terrae]|uniref:C-methyltransferase domain-containing protein n=1 Tax=Klenkia terrae TaxID=1052259 RepID=A0ABU8E0Z0_9ACTN
MRTWRTHVADEVAALRRHLEDAREAGRRARGYRAASRSIPLLGAAGIGPDLLPAIADAAPGKQGRTLPAGAIPVISPAQLVAAAPDEVILSLPDLLAEVRRSVAGIEAAGGRWIDVGDLLIGRGATSV